MNNLNFISSSCCFLILILVSCLSYGQTREVIASGRPGQSIGANVVGTGILQFQSGVQADSQSGGGGSEASTFNNVIRYGLSESFELSGVIDYNSQKFKNSMLRRDGISGLQVGFRYNLLPKPAGWLPTLCIQSRFKLTTVGSDYQPQAVAPITILSMVFSLNRDFSFTTNGIINYDGNTAIPTYGFTANLGYNIADNLETFVEVYGNEKAGVDRHYIDSGFGYFVTNDWKLDISYGWGENFGVTESFVSIGFSTRLHTKSKPRIPNLN